jgi:hypothetical protein
MAGPKGMAWHSTLESNRRYTDLPEQIMSPLLGKLFRRWPAISRRVWNYSSHSQPRRQPHLAFHETGWNNKKSGEAVQAKHGIVESFSTTYWTPGPSSPLTNTGVRQSIIVESTVASRLAVVS